MKRYVVFGCAMALGLSACLAAQSESESASAAAIEMSASSVNVPTGIFWDGSNFIKVADSWLRVCIGGQSRDYDFHAEMDPRGNYVLTFGQGECITIYSNGRSLYYNGKVYSKK